MNLAKLFEMQRKLDAHIEKEHPRKSDEDRLAKKILALQVELGELAQEWRGFKYWSNKQTPTVETETCDYCGEEVDYTRPSPFMEVANMCKACWNMTREEYIGSDGVDIGKFEDYPHFKTKQPSKLLEEYVDCLHFILSIGLELNVNPKEIKGIYERSNVIEQFNAVFDCVSRFWNRVDRGFSYDEQVEWYIWAFKGFIVLGHKLGFKWEEIEQAYIEKNQENHRRQEVGY